MAGVEKITIALTPEMASFVRRAVEAGDYASTSEAIREAVREWKDRRDLLGYTVEELRALAQEGIDSGPATDGEAEFAELAVELSGKLPSRRSA